MSSAISGVRIVKSARGLVVVKGPPTFRGLAIARGPVVTEESVVAKRLGTGGGSEPVSSN